jgi:2-desacetyl-2-hydroxyethyl bacteriochlorophyllide A dehydrogenase
MNNTMRALVWTGPEKVELQELPIPRPAEGWALIRTIYGGICGSDITIRGGHHPRARPPLIMGHEMAGQVVTTNGSENYAGTSTPVKEGDIVAVEPLLSCGVCGPCKKGAGHVCEKLRLLGVETDGGFADYFTAPLYRLYKKPDAVSLEELALAEPLAVAVHSVNMGRPEKGDRAVIIGAGPIGLLIGETLKARGVDSFWISELDNRRLAMARKLGFSTIDAKTENPVEKILEYTKGHGADMTFDAAGVPPVGPQLVPITAIMGRIVLTALYKKPCEVSFRQLSYGEMSILGTRIYAQGDFGEGIRLMDSGKVKTVPLITHMFEMTDYENAFACAADSSKSCKVLIHVQDGI